MIGKLDLINRWLLLLLGFFIPISTALTNIVLGLIILFFLIDNASDRFQRWILILKSNPVAFMGLAVFLIHVAGLFYTGGEKDRVIESLNDGAKFLFVSLAMIYFKEKQHLFKFLFSFALSMLVTLFLSYLLWMDRLPGFIPVKGGPLDCCIFHDHIIQNIFMAFMVFLAAVRARAAGDDQVRRILWGIFSLLALFNVLFMVGGRTGHLIAGVLFLYYFVSWSRAKGFIIAVLVLLFLVVSAWVIPSNSFFLRAKTAKEEIHAWEYGKKANTDSSSGIRLEFYINTLKIIKENPVFGAGTGSFEAAYRLATKNAGMNPTNNPHNEFLMTAAQFGLFGLLTLSGFFWVQWRNTVFFEDKQHTLISRGFILTILTACMVSSPLVDHAEGWFFASMSAALFAGLDTRKAQDKRKMGVA